MNTTILASFAAFALATLVHAQGCIGDVAVDGQINGGDLGMLLANWGPATPAAISHACDIDANGQIDGADLGLTLANWGPCPAGTWCTIIEAQPDPTVVTDLNLRAAISASGYPWRIWDRSTKIEMLLVPPGGFQMGCIVGSDRFPCRIDELPVHGVTLTSAFYLGRYEVTQAQWQSKMGANPSWYQYGNSYPGSIDRPVEQVSWVVVQGFLGVTELRLPTEAEWEYACRAGTQPPFYNGMTEDSTIGTIAWNTGNAWQTMPVGRLEPNAFGFHDMLGNVGEWVNDWYGSYVPGLQTNPTGSQNGTTRVIRGGSITGTTGDTRSSARSAGLIGLTSNAVGFRVARSP